MHDYSLCVIGTLIVAHVFGLRMYVLGHMRLEQLYLTFPRDLDHSMNIIINIQKLFSSNAFTAATRGRTVKM